MDYTNEKVKRAGEIIQSFVTINKALTKFTQQNAASLGLTLPQMGILNTIFSAPGITLKEITEKLFISKSTVSVSVDDLVKTGLVERKSSVDDRREIKLKVTNKGKELSRKSCDNALSYKAMLLALEKISEDEIQSLIRIHKKLLAQLKEFEF